MCGIVGAFGTVDAGTIQPYVDMLRHRGPDGSGLCQTATGALGHTRLAIVDVEGGIQPQALGRLRISFNGEIYNHIALRQAYLADEPLATRSDTEVVLRLYAKLGPKFVELLDGMFAIAIIDDDTLFLARDPIGIKPLYIGMDGVSLHFASEIKAMASGISSVQTFPPGHWYHSQLGINRYYTVGQARKPFPRAHSEDDAERHIRSLLREAVIKRLMADVPVGVSLSGGLDSSIVTLLAREGVPQLHSFAVGVEGSEDLAAARMVAAYLGTQHHERVYDNQEMLAILPEVLYYLESFDPALVRSAIPNYFLAQLAAEHVKVMLTGEGADELYAGYAYLEDIDAPDALQKELEYIVGSLHNTNLQRADRMSMAFGLEARVPFLDVQSIAYALTLPTAWKLQTQKRVEKALLRNAFAGQLPDAVIRRPKQKFSSGAGSSQLLRVYAEEKIANGEFETERGRLYKQWGYQLPSKEALYYYKILSRMYKDDRIFPTMGISRSL